MKKKILVATIIFIFFVGIFFIFYKSPVNYSFNGNSFSYSANRPIPDYEISFNFANGSVNIYSVNFQSRNFMNYSTRIYGLLFMPADKKNVPGLVFLPGGGVKKEGMISRSIALANLGYAIFVIDQRGIGETGGIYLGLEQDYQAFSNGYEPVQHLSVYDGLAASDVLRGIKNVDRNNIGIAGESMGGRYAVIAAAIDPNLKGVIAISVAGYHVNSSLDEPYTPFLLSVDPDNYIGKISPRPVLMLQGDNDSVVNYQDAEYTFSLANQPKRFFLAKGCEHGYCNLMADELKTDLNILFGK